MKEHRVEKRRTRAMLNATGDGQRLETRTRSVLEAPHDELVRIVSQLERLIEQFDAKIRSQRQLIMRRMSDETLSRDRSSRRRKPPPDPREDRPALDEILHAADPREHGRVD